MTAESTRGTGLGLDRLERWWAHAYARVGSRIVLLAIAACAPYVVPGSAIGYVVLVDYLGLPSSQVFPIFAIWVAGTFVLAIAGLALSAAQIRTVLTWSGDRRTTARASEVWTAIVGAPVIVARCALLGSVGVTGFLMHVVVRFHEPAWLVGPFVLAAVLFAASMWAVTAFTALLLMRPMLADVAAHLPPDFRPPRHGLGLRARMLAPLPLISLFGAFVVGAFANMVPDGAGRYALTLAVTLPVGILATVIFLIIARSVLDPIEELTAITERVRAGDTATPAGLISDDELGGLAHSFNVMVADLRRREEDLRASRERIVAAADAERRRVERDLHDGAQQHLVLLGLKLSMLQRLIKTDPDAAQANLAELRDELDHALAELRNLAHGIYPAVLESDGLRAALREAAERAPIATEVECDGAGRYSAEIEAAVYFCCLEALQNAGKHAGSGAQAVVTLRQRSGALVFDITDNGAGFDLDHKRDPSTGLQNMVDRIGALGGDLRIRSHPGQGTRINGAVPIS